MKLNIAKFAAKVAVHSVATTIIIGKAVAHASSSFATEVTKEVVARQEREEEMEEILNPTTPQHNPPSMRDFVNKGDVEC
jgi:hypothetical protein|tara:strand:+ start:513 stop:752 length:240 start_codon:yes stop_codon:yes gene_type:complete